MTNRMLDSEKVLITGATGKIAFPIARALAQRSEVRSAVPDDFTYVFHAAVDVGAGEWTQCVETNAQNSGRRCHGATVFGG